MSLRLAAWILLVALISGWWLTSLARQPLTRGDGTPIIEQPAPTPFGSHFTERLKRGLRTAPGAPLPRRNPFFFAAREQAARDVPTPAFAPPPPPVEAPRRALSLAGVATTKSADGPIRTAVLSTEQGIILAKVDDVLPNGMRVVRVEEDHVVLLDSGGAETKLYLK